MKHKSTKFLAVIVLSIVTIIAFAQQPQSKEEEEKKLREAIDAQIEAMTNQYDLEGWQVFYVDSIMTHDYTAMRDELQSLSIAKVSNGDVYIRVQDKWMEQIYQSFSKVFDEKQWTKYLKSGAAREKKARDKRESKRNTAK